MKRLIYGDSNFESEYESIKSKAKASETQWNGDYLVTTYTFKNNTKAKYWFNADLGIPSEIEYV